MMAPSTALVMSLACMIVVGVVEGGGSPNLVEEPIPTSGCGDFIQLAKDVINKSSKCEITTTDAKVLCTGRDVDTVDPVYVMQRTRWSTCDMKELESLLVGYEDTITFPQKMVVLMEKYEEAKKMTKEHHDSGWATTVYASEALQFYNVINTLLGNRMDAFVEVAQTVVNDGIEPSLNAAVTDAIVFTAMLVWDMSLSEAPPQGKKLIRKGRSKHELNVVNAYYKAETPIEWKSFMSTSDRVVSFGQKFVVWSISDDAGCAKDITPSKELFSDETEYLLLPNTILEITNVRTKRPPCPECKGATGRFKSSCLHQCYREDPPYHLATAKTIKC